MGGWRSNKWNGDGMGGGDQINGMAMEWGGGGQISWRSNWRSKWRINRMKVEEERV